MLGVDSPLLLFAIESMEVGMPAIAVCDRKYGCGERLPAIYYLRQVILLGAGSVVKQSVGEDQGFASISNARLVVGFHEEPWPVANSI